MIDPGSDKREYLGILLLAECKPSEPFPAEPIPIDIQMVGIQTNSDEPFLDILAQFAKGAEFIAKKRVVAAFTKDDPTLYTAEGVTLATVLLCHNQQITVEGVYRAAMDAAADFNAMHRDADTQGSPDRQSHGGT